MRTEYGPAQKTSIEVGRDGVTLTGNQSDYMGTIIWGGVGILLLLGVALIKWGPALKGLFKNGKSGANGIPVNGKARVDDISGLLNRVIIRIDTFEDTMNDRISGIEKTFNARFSGVEKTIADNRLLLADYKCKSDSTDAGQKEQIKALQRKVFGEKSVEEDE